MSVRKLDNYAEVTVYCSTCKKKITIKVDYSKRDEAKRFPFEYVYIHGEPKHAITIYLDKDMQVRGTEILNNLNLDEIGIGPKETLKEKLQIPKVKEKIPPMALELGIISKKALILYNEIDGKKSIFELHDILNIGLEEIKKMLDELIEKNLIEIIEKK
ncbi:MAG: hypothetical protein ACTSXF_12125 [Promethearchaeota archaeon]